jgi:hypothetical protein
MLVDYLRYLAFRGPLRNFFEGGLANFVEPSATTGQHLRFTSRYIDDLFHSPDPPFYYRYFWREERTVENLRWHLGFVGGPDSLIGNSFAVDGPPQTSVYKPIHPTEVEIIIDIDPAAWTERYLEGNSYEGFPISYRKSRAAKGQLKSGDRLGDSQRSRREYGTLCGVFQTSHGNTYGLTCGHVVGNGAHITLEERRRRWLLPLRSRSSLGMTCHRATCQPRMNGDPVRTQLDAALIAVDPRLRRTFDASRTHPVTIRPISAIFQEEPVRFRGSGRPLDTLAKVAAITVRKSIDLYRDGNLRDVGDVLMLGHRQPMYVVQHVSRPGDSGAAVCHEYLHSQNELHKDIWEGMILGGDEAGSYATYAEHLWAWATQVTDDSDLDFRFEF